MFAFLVVGGTCVILAMYFSPWILALAPLLLLLCRQLCANDDAFFAVMAVRLRVRSEIRNARLRGGVWMMVPDRIRGSALRPFRKVSPR